MVTHLQPAGTISGSDMIITDHVQKDTYYSLFTQKYAERWYIYWVCTVVHSIKCLTYSHVIPNKILKENPSLWNPSLLQKSPWKTSDTLSQLTDFSLIRSPPYACTVSSYHVLSLSLVINGSFQHDVFGKLKETLSVNISLSLEFR